MNSVSPSEPLRVLITGIDGFTGSYLSRRLRQDGFQVFGTVRSAHAPLQPGVFAVDLGDRPGIARVVDVVRPDYVVHLAAISFVAHGDVAAIYNINIVGTRNLLEALALAHYRPRQVLLASSANIYGSTTVEVIDEAVTPCPANDYAVSKLAMEHAANLWRDRLPIVVVRPFNYTGVGQGAQFLIPKIVSHFQRRETVIELGNIDVERDFADVRRVVDSYAKLMCSGIEHGVFNVCTGQTHSLTNIIGIMEQIAGYSITVKVNPAFVRANEVKRLQGDCGKLVAAVGGLLDIPLKDTLKWMFESPTLG